MNVVGRDTATRSRPDDHQRETSKRRNVLRRGRDCRASARGLLSSRRAHEGLNVARGTSARLAERAPRIQPSTAPPDTGRLPTKWRAGRPLTERDPKRVDPRKGVSEPSRLVPGTARLQGRAAPAACTMCRRSRLFRAQASRSGCLSLTATPRRRRQTPRVSLDVGTATADESWARLLGLYPVFGRERSSTDG